MKMTFFRKTGWLMVEQPSREGCVAAAQKFYDTYPRYREDMVSWAEGHPEGEFKRLREESAQDGRWARFVDGKLTTSWQRPKISDLPMKGATYLEGLAAERQMAAIAKAMGNALATGMEVHRALPDPSILRDGQVRKALPDWRTSTPFNPFSEPGWVVEKGQAVPEGYRTIGPRPADLLGWWEA